jgi:hypothetical protein
MKDPFDAILDKYKSLGQKKQEAVAREANEKKLRLDQNNPLYDADSPALQGGGTGRLASAEPGYYADAPEVSRTRWENNPKNRDYQAQNVGALMGKPAESVTDEDIFRFGNEATRRAQESLEARGGAIPVGVTTPQGETQDIHKRPFMDVTTPEGGSLVKEVARDPRQPGFEHPENYAGRVDYARGTEWPEHWMYQGSKGVGGDLLDATKRFVIAAPEMALTMAGELGTLIPGGEGIGSGLSGWAKEVGENARKSWLSPKEQMEERRFQRTLNEYNNGRDQRVQKHIEDGHSPAVAEALNTLDEFKFAFGEMWARPGRVMNAVGESLPSVIGGGVGGKVGLKAAQKFIGKHRNTLLKNATPEQLQKYQAAAATIGAAGSGALLEASSTSSEMYQKILDTPLDELRKDSSKFLEYKEKFNGDELKAREALAEDGRLWAFAGMAALTATTGLASGTAKFQKGMFTRFFDEAKQVQRGAARRLAKGAGTALGRGGQEMVEEIGQSGGEAILSNAVENMLAGKETPLMSGAGSAGALGALGGLHTGATMSATTSGVKAATRRRQPGPRVNRRQAPEIQTPAGKPNNVKFNNPHQEQGMKPELRNALGNVGMDLTITSGTRSKEENDAAGGAGKSRHVHGDAADISTANMSTDQKKDLVRKLYAQGVTRFGTYKGDSYIHVDMKGDKYHPMHERTISNIKSAPKWFQEVSAELQGQAPGASVSQGTATSAAVPNNPVAKSLNNAIIRSAHKNDLPPMGEAMLKAIVEGESSWGQNVRGPKIGVEVSGDPAQYGKSASGPFQFMADTAQRLNLKDPFDHNQSAEAAGKMLNESYTAIRKAYPDISEKEAWLMAGVAHHSGLGNVLKNSLGPNGKEYMAKLRKALPKYLKEPGKVGAVAGNIREGLRGARKAATKAITPEQVKEGTASSEQPERSYEDYVKESPEYFRDNPDELAGLDRAMASKMQALTEEINSPDLSSQRRQEIIQEATEASAYKKAVEAATIGVEANASINNKIRELGSSDFDISDESKSTINSILSEEASFEDLSPEELDAILDAEEKGFASDEMSVVTEGISKGHVDENNIEKLLESNLPETQKEIIRAAQKVGQKEYNTLTDKFGEIALNLPKDENGNYKLGLAGHQRRIQQEFANLQDNDGDVSDKAIRPGTARNALHALNTFADSQSLERKQQARKSKGQPEYYGKTKASIEKEHKVIEDVLQDLADLYNKMVDDINLNRGLARAKAKTAAEKAKLKPIIHYETTKALDDVRRAAERRAKKENKKPKKEQKKETKEQKKETPTSTPVTENPPVEEEWQPTDADRDLASQISSFTGQSVDEALEDIRKKTLKENKNTDKKEDESTGQQQNPTDTGGQQGGPAPKDETPPPPPPDDLGQPEKPSKPTPSSINKSSLPDIHSFTVEIDGKPVPYVQTVAAIENDMEQLDRLLELAQKREC